MRFINGIKRRVRYVLGRIQIYVLERKKLSYALAENSEPIVVSFTTYPPRLKWVHLVVRSMMVQTMKPDKIVLYVGDDVELKDIPDDVQQLTKYGLEIKKVEGNLKPHKKYQYAMEEYPNSLIITIDDDLIYHKDLVKTLYEGHQKFPDSVIAIRGHEITFNDDGTIKPYREWNMQVARTCYPSMKLFAAGGSGGVLYPPHCLSTRAFDKELVNKLCLNADDVWLKMMEVLVGTKVSIYKPWLYNKYILCRGLKKDSGLNEENVGLNANDMYIAQVIDRFNINTCSLNQEVGYLD